MTISLSEVQTMSTFSYSTNEETYQGDYASPEAAAEAGFQDNPDYDSLWIGINKKFTAHDFISVSDILDGIAENAGDECGEAAEDWLVKIEKDPVKRDELCTLLGDWLEANDPVTFCSVDEVIKFERKT
jgi:hypothetical protein